MTGATLRVGILGCAEIAWRMTLPAFDAEPSVEVTAIASRDLERARRFTDRFGGRPVGSYAELLSRHDIDAVYIPLPALLHAQWVEQALEAGKHVLVEKPMTDSAAQTRALVSSARSRGLVLLENYMFLHHSQHAAVDKLLADGEIGGIRGFSAAFTFPPKPPGDVRLQPVGGGAFDFAGYPVRAALRFLGPELHVIGAVLRRDRAHDVVVSGAVLLATDDGVPAQVSFGMEHSYRNCYAISGSTGRLELDRVFTPPPTHRPEVRLWTQDHRRQLDLPADDQFANVVRGFARSALAESGGHDPAVRDLQDGSIQQAELIDGIRAAATEVVVDALPG